MKNPLRRLPSSGPGWPPGAGFKAAIRLIWYLFRGSRSLSGPPPPRGRRRLDPLAPGLPHEPGRCLGRSRHSRHQN
jgi:hypothetical protein